MYGRSFALVSVALSAALSADLPSPLRPPPPIVRVLIGRLECITPAVEAEVEQALRDRTSEDGDVRRAATSRLDRLGRFLEPHLRRALARTHDDLVRTSATEVLAGT